MIMIYVGLNSLVLASTNMSEGVCEAAVSEHNGGNWLSSSESVLLSFNIGYLVLC